MMDVYPHFSGTYCLSYGGKEQTGWENSGIDHRERDGQIRVLSFTSDYTSIRLKEWPYWPLQHDLLRSIVHSLSQLTVEQTHALD
jgi:hypothetical protein